MPVSPIHSPGVAACTQRFFEDQAGCRLPDLEVGEAVPRMNLPICSTGAQIEALRNFSSFLGSNNETGIMTIDEYRLVYNYGLPVGTEIYKMTGCLQHCHKSQYLAYPDGAPYEKILREKSPRKITFRFVYKKVT